MSDRTAAFKQMLKDDPDNTMVMFGLANEYLKASEFELGIRILEEYLEKSDDEGAAWGMLSNAYQELGETEKARSALEKGVETASRHGHPTMAAEFQERIDLLN